MWSQVPYGSRGLIGTFSLQGFYMDLRVWRDQTVMDIKVLRAPHAVRRPQGERFNIDTAGIEPRTFLGTGIEPATLAVKRGSNHRPLGYGFVT